MAFNTRHPVGSTDPRDLYDNATNFDKLINGSDPFYADRLGKLRQSWSGMEADFANSQEGRAAAFDDFLKSSGFVILGDYGPNIKITSRSQLIIRDGSLYRLAYSVTLPYTTTGNWANESTNFVLQNSGDVFRQDLANTTDYSKGAALIARGFQVVPSVAVARTLNLSGKSGMVFIRSFYGDDKSGGGEYFIDTSDTTTLDDGGLNLVTADGVRLKLKHNGTINASVFGVVGDDATDNQPMHALAIAAIKKRGRGTLYYSPGVYRQSGTFSVSVTDAKISIKGAGIGQTVFRNTSANKPTIEVATGSYYVTVQDLTLDRTVTATDGGNGLNFGKSGVAEGNVYRVHSTKNWNGFALGGCSYNLLQNCQADYNKYDGFNITNSDVYSTCQWYFDGALSQLNDRDGFHIESVGTKTGTPSGGNMSVGELSGVRTFANGRYGLAIVDNATVGIYGIRVKKYFFGEDNSGEVYMDIKGEDNMFNDGFVELAGMSTAGVGSSVGVQGATATAASKNAFGIIVTARVPDVGFDFIRITGCSRSGIYSSSPKLRVSNARIKNCGAGTGTTPVDKSGIYINAGNMRAVNVDSTGQGYGSYNGSVGGDVYVGCDMRNNATATIGGTTTNNRVDATTYA